MKNIIKSLVVVVAVAAVASVATYAVWNDNVVSFLNIVQRLVDNAFIFIERYRLGKLLEFKHCI